MAYLITRFGDEYATAEVLPTAGGEQPLGAGGVPSGRIRLPGGGSFDAWGRERPQPQAHQITVRGRWSAASVTAMETKVDALAALKGRRSKLWRSNGVAQRWRYARCLRVEVPAGRGTPTSDEISLDFELEAGPWYGLAHSDTILVDASPKTIAAANGGNARVTNPVITITAAGSAITRIKIAVSGVSELQWDGSLAVAKSLVIDCGARSIKNNGIDAYAGLTLTANHRISDWLRLEPGNNSVVITRTGGDNASSVRLQYSDGWA